MNGKSLVVVFFMLFIMGFFCVGIYALSGASPLWQPFPQTQLEDQVRTEINRYGVVLPPNAQFARVQATTQEGASELWAAIQLDKKQVGRLTDGLHRFAARDPWMLDESATLTAEQLGRHPPDWWQPQKLAGAQPLLLRHEGGLLIFSSPKTGGVYLLIYDFPKP